MTVTETTGGSGMQTHGAILEGVRIIDLTDGLAGPVATRLLAEFGASVIKIEGPGGDPIRRLNPPAFATWNRSKRSMMIDFDSSGGREELGHHLGAADIVVHGFTRAGARSRGLDDETLAKRFPRLIVASVTAYPRNHPDEERYGSEILVQARLGAMDEQQALRPGPMFVRMPFSSWGAAYLMAGGVLVRLLERNQTGEANPIHTSLLQGALLPASLYWQRAEAPPGWMARHTLQRDDHPSNLTIFRCADGRWIHAMGGFPHAEPMTAVLRELGREPLASSGVTLANREEWATVFATKSVGDWTALLWSAGVICMPVLDMGEILTTEQARLNGYAVPVTDERFGLTTQAGFPVTTKPAPQVLGGAPWTNNVSAEIDDVERPLPVISTTDSGAAPRASRRSAPLGGLRVVDFGAYVAGPMGAQCLADFGADVIKVEPPWGERGRTINQFNGCQRGKRSLAIDMHNPATRVILERLLLSADVVVHNVREPTAKRLGIDEASVRTINPRAVFAHSSAYGQYGPWADFGAFDPAACALSGWEMHIAGPDNRPTWLRNSSMDCHTGLALFVGILLSLYQRALRGKSDSVNTSLMAVAATSTSETLVLDDGSFSPFSAIDRQQMGVSPYYRIYQTGDGWIAVSACEEAQQQALLTALAVGTGEDLEGAIKSWETDSLLIALEKAGVAVEKVALDNRDRFFDAELGRDLGLVLRTESKPYGEFEGPAGYWSDDGTLIRSPGTIPDIGEHTAEVLEELGFTNAEIAEFVTQNVVSEQPVAQPSSLRSNPVTRSLSTFD